MKRLFSLLLALAVLCAVLPAFAADPVPVESITLNETAINVPVGRGFNLKAVVEPKNASNKKLAWTSSDESVATIRNGQVVGVSAGTAVITAAAEDGSGVTASAEVTVIVPVKKITIAGEKNLPLAQWVSWKLSVSVEPYEATNMDVIWSSSDEKVATVDQNGVVTGQLPGTAKITATAADGSQVRASVTVKVSKYDLVFTSKGSQNVSYSYGSGIFRIRGSVKTGCVKIPELDTSVLAAIGSRVQEESIYVKPVKPGEDEVKITTGKQTFVYKVFVSPEAFPTSSVAVQAAEGEAENGEPAEILFLNVPWGSTYSEANAVLKDQNNSLKPPAKNNDYLRSMVSGEVTLSTVTAFRAAMNFSYDQEDPQYKSNNAFYKGDLYFDPEVPFEQIQLAIRNEYGLERGTGSGDQCTWEQGGVKLVLTKKEKFTILEIFREGEEE